MKTKILSLICLWLTICLSPTLAQSGDTTKISMGKKKIIIIDDNEKIEAQKENLRQAILEFKQEIVAIEDSISKIEARKNTTDSPEKKAKYDEEIADYKKQIQAMDKGIADIEGQIAEMENTKKPEKSRANHFWSDEFWDWDLYKNTTNKFVGHWNGFDIGLNNFVNSDFEMKMPENADFMEVNASSWAFNLNFLEYNIELFNNQTGLVTGAGLEWNNYNFKNSIKLVENENGVIEGLTTDYNYDKNKLHTGFFTVPLLIEFQSANSEYSKRFHFAVGVIGGVKIGSKTVQKYKVDGDNKKTKIKNDYQLNAFRYAATVRMGYGKLRLFASYNIVPLFEDEKGPELYPFTVGLTLINF